MMAEQSAETIEPAKEVAKDEIASKSKRDAKALHDLKALIAKRPKLTAQAVFGVWGRLQNDIEAR
jgi:hypothetical protein